MQLDLIDEHIVKLLKSAGCIRVQVGIESGSEEYREKYLNRKIPQQLMIRRINAVKKLDIQLYTFNMPGGPEETPAQVLETIKLNALCYVDKAKISFMHPYAGTEILKYCKEKDLLDPGYKEGREDRPAIRNERMDSELLIFYKKNFLKLMRFYRQVNRMPALLSLLFLKISDFVFVRNMVIFVFPFFESLFFYYRFVRNRLLGMPTPVRDPGEEDAG